MKIGVVNGRLMFGLSSQNISCECIGEPFSKVIADEFAALVAANEHNEAAIRRCNQKIAELERWNADLRNDPTYNLSKRKPRV